MEKMAKTIKCTDAVKIVNCCLDSVKEKGLILKIYSKNECHYIINSVRHFVYNDKVHTRSEIVNLCLGADIDRMTLNYTLRSKNDVERYDFQ